MAPPFKDRNLCTKCGEAKEPNDKKSHHQYWCVSCAQSYRVAQYAKRKKEVLDGTRLQKPCTNCGRDRDNLHQHRCAPCEKARVWAWNLKTKYNMTVCDFTKLRIESNDCCQICGELPNRGAVDHDHVTGKVRGYLCFDCNTGIGKLGDSVRGLEVALDYLRKAEA